MSSPTQNAIIWPSHYLPGTTSNFTSNETIVSSLSASKDIWPLLSDITKWQTYYHNCSDITPPSSGSTLHQGSTFKFSTFGFPVLTCNVEESVPPTASSPGRLAWSAKLDGGPEEKVEVYHAWLVEDLDGGRVRILTQESQIGKPAAELSKVKPNKMLLGHQDWLDGLVAKARGEEVDVRGGETHLGKAGF